MPEVDSTLLHEFGRKFAADAMLQNVVSDRIYIGGAPQGVQKPYVVLYQILSEPYHDLQGEIGKSKSIVQVDIWDDGIDAVLHVKRAGNAIRGIFANGFRGALVEGGIHLDGCEVTRYDVTGTKRMDGSEIVDYRCSMDLETVHEDPIEE